MTKFDLRFRPKTRLKPLVMLSAFALILGACTSSTDDPDVTSDTSAPDTATTPSTAPPTTAPEKEPVDVDSAVSEDALGLNWHVVGVDFFDEEGLNVREAPGTKSDVVGNLEMWESGFEVTDEVKSTGSEKWRKIELTDGTQGWVNERFIIAQPETLTSADEKGLGEATENLVKAVVDNEDTPEKLVADRGLWVNEMQAWHWVPKESVSKPSDWNNVKIAETPDALDDESCEDEPEICNRSIAAFLGLETLDNTTVTLVDDRRFVAANTKNFTSDADSSLHWVVLDKPGTEELGELDWQRVYFIYDWSTGEPKISSIFSYSWTI